MTLQKGRQMDSTDIQAISMTCFWLGNNGSAAITVRVNSKRLARISLSVIQETPKRSSEGDGNGWLKSVYKGFDLSESSFRVFNKDSVPKYLPWPKENWPPMKPLTNKYIIQWQTNWQNKKQRICGRVSKTFCNGCLWVAGQWYLGTSISIRRWLFQTLDRRERFFYMMTSPSISGRQQTCPQWQMECIRWGNNRLR